MMEDMNLPTFRQMNCEWLKRLRLQELSKLVSVHYGISLRGVAVLYPTTRYPIAAAIAWTSPSISAFVRFSVTATINRSLRSAYHRPACRPAK